MPFTDRRVHSRRLNLIQSFLVLILIVFVIFQFINVHFMMATAKVINYAGLVRGGTQRLIKLEIAYVQDDSLIQSLDEILSGLQNGGGSYGLKKINNAPFQYKIELLLENWAVLKNQIELFRNHQCIRESLITLSETYFHLSDNAVFAAQAYAEQLTARQTYFEIVMSVCMLFILSILGKLTYDAIHFSRIAYTDKHTRLPNKSRCEEILNDKSFLEPGTAFIMFDLNYLKKVNDTLGHSAGDSLILNFATILRKAIPARHFLGRYGGDEFIAVLNDVQESDVIEIMKEVHGQIEQFNSFSRQTEISFAYGYALASDYQECTMHTLLEQADRNMYLLKKKMHALREC